MRRWVACGSAALGVLAAARAHAQAKSEIAVTRQPGILYLASHVMEEQKLIEAHAAKAGIADLKVNWLNLSGGGAQTDALLAGSVDIVNTGTGNLLLLWDRTRGRVKGIVGTSAQPVLLLSREERIKTLADIRPEDKIAVPTVKISTQAILLQMAAAKMYGDSEVNKFDANTVQLGHPDAMAAMSNARHEVTSHFSAPPFQYLELAAGAHLVASSKDLIREPLSPAPTFTPTHISPATPAIVNAGPTAA